MRPGLLILDDLGSERNTSFGKERVFNLVNNRLLSGKPMIIATNIHLTVMQKATDLDNRRIYDQRSVSRLYSAVTVFEKPTLPII